MTPPLSSVTDTPCINEDVQETSSSLGILTSLFMKELLSTPDKSVNIQDMAEKLRTTKRRIYDIIAVLEGIGLVKKLQKSVVQLTQGSLYSQQQSQLQSLSEKNVHLVQELENLQKNSQCASDYLKTLRQNPHSTFVTHSDFLSILDESDTTVVIRAPKGTLLEVRDAREVYIDSHNAGPIELFICAGTHGLTRVERADPPETPCSSNASPPLLLALAV